MTISNLLGLVAFLIPLIAIAVALSKSQSRKRAYAKSKAAKSNLVGTGTLADRIFGVLELVAAALLIILSVAIVFTVIPAFFSFVFGIGLAWDGYSRITSKSRRTLIKVEQRKEFFENQREHRVGDFLQHLGEQRNDLVSQVACPHCGQLVLFHPSTAGQIVACPNCSRNFQMP